MSEEENVVEQGATDINAIVGMVAAQFQDKFGDIDARFEELTKRVAIAEEKVTEYDQLNKTVDELNESFGEIKGLQGVGGALDVNVNDHLKKLEESSNLHKTEMEDFMMKLNNTHEESKKLEHKLARVIETEAQNIRPVKEQLSETNMATVWALYHDEPVHNPGFFPSKEQLLRTSLNDLRNLALARIDFMDVVTINSLTFVFSDGTRSPPRDTYKAETVALEQETAEALGRRASVIYRAEPSHKYEIPREEQVGGIEFGLNEYGHLNLLKVIFKSATEPHEIRGSYSVESSEAIEVRPEENIVSAAVIRSDDRPVQIQFVVFTE